MADGMSVVRMLPFPGNFIDCGDSGKDLAADFNGKNCSNYVLGGLNIAINVDKLMNTQCAL